jgi:hypothetical protein
VSAEYKGHTINRLTFRKRGFEMTYSGNHPFHTSPPPASSYISTRTHVYGLVNIPNYDAQVSTLNHTHTTQLESGKAYIVSMTLIRRSQPHPVMINAAAGGNIIATMMRTTSEDLTMVFCWVVCCGNHL